MSSVRDEIRDIEEGRVGLEESALRNAPHTADMIAADGWNRPYTRFVFMVFACELC